MELKKSNEELPKRDGLYFIISKYGMSELARFERGQWHRLGRESETLCINCDQFKWLDIKECNPKCKG